MGTLNEDLNKYAGETFTKKDLKAGWKLIGEVLGVVGVVGVAFTALTVWIPGIGIPIAAGSLGPIIFHVTKSYANLDTKERKQVRAVIRTINGGSKVWHH